MLEPGQIFASRYRVRRRIAEGGMGAIFEAEHTATERRVALKLLFPHIIGVGNVLEKFELEAKVSARVGCPHIVEVLDAGYDSVTQSPFLVMELLDGQTLARRVDEHGALSVDEALHVLRQVAVGLDAAHGYREPGGHAKPIVHRDLKPENLFLANGRDGSVSVKILDYGIAKVLGGSASISQDVRGTPLFMAVEQVTASELSPQTDIWAFGLIAYYTLTGSHYWRSAQRSDVSVQALFAEILSLPLQAPSTRAREQNPRIELPPGFDAWLLRCIDREPARRFPSAGDAFEVLRGRFEEAAALPAAQVVPKGRRAEVPVQAAAARPGVAGGSVPALATTQHRPPMQRDAAANVPRWAYIGATGALALGLVVWLGVGLGGSEPPRADPAAGSAGPSPPPAPASHPRTEPSIAPVRARGGAGAPDRPVPERAAIVRVVPIDEPGPAVAPMVGSVGSAPVAEASLGEAAHDEPARNEAMRHEAARNEAMRDEAMRVDPARGDRALEKKRRVRVNASTQPAGAPKAAVAGAAPATPTKPPPMASEAYRVR